MSYDVPEDMMCLDPDEDLEGILMNLVGVCSCVPTDISADLFYDVSQARFMRYTELCHVCMVFAHGLAAGAKGKEGGYTVVCLLLYF